MQGGLDFSLALLPGTSIEPVMIKSIAVKSVRKAQSSELVKRAQSSTSLSLRKAQSKELGGTFGQVVKKKLGRSCSKIFML